MVYAPEREEFLRDFFYPTDITDGKDRSHQAPADGLCQGDTKIPQGGNQEHGGGHLHRELQHRRHKRDELMSHTLQGTAQIEQRAQSREEADHHLGVHFRLILDQDVLRTGDPGGDASGKEQAEEDENDGLYGHDDIGDPYPLPDPVDPARTHILTDIGGHGETEGVDQGHQDIDQTSSCEMCSYGIRSETVDGTLKDDGPDIYDAAHESHGESGEEQLMVDGTGNEPVLLLRKVLPEMGHRIGEAGNAADPLGDDRGNGSAFDPPAEAADEQHVQQEIQNDGNDQTVLQGS